jgi:hypothetical protein
VPVGVHWTITLAVTDSDSGFSKSHQLQSQSDKLETLAVVFLKACCRLESTRLRKAGGIKIRMMFW